MSNVKNYTEQGGERWVVKGELELVEEGRLLFSGQELKPAAGQADSEASTVAALKEDFNALLGRFFAAGLMVVDRSGLEAVIDEARDLLAAAEVGYGSGDYYQDDYDTFAAAVDDAQRVLDNKEALQSTVSAAAGTLETAILTFVAAASEIDKTALASIIDAAQGILDVAIIGSDPGEYPQESYTIFETAITSAQTVLGDKTTTQSTVDEAVTTLESAITAFESAVVIE